MGTPELKEIKSMLPMFTKHNNVWSNYDEEADTLYLHFDRPNHADNSEMIEDSVIVRYENERIIGMTILNAGKR